MSITYKFIKVLSASVGSSPKRVYKFTMPQFFSKQKNKTCGHRFGQIVSNYAQGKSRASLEVIIIYRERSMDDLNKVFQIR